jgi:preprotein translocase subunit YajC
MLKHRKLFLGAISLVFVAFCFSTSNAQMDESKEKSSTQSVTGCLQKGDETGGFTIAGADGKVWELQSKKVKLSDHVGHTVTVTGSAAKESKSTEEKMESNEKKEAAGKEYSDLKVYSLKMVSDSCK